MAEFPAFPLFTDAYLGDTQHLSTIEHGAYLLLLIVAWRSKGSCLPDDDARLAKHARMTRGQWARIAPTIREFFTARDGALYQSRLTDEAKHVRQVREKQREAGRASALKRKDRHATDVHVPLSGRATPSPSPTPTSDIAKATSLSALPRRPDCVEGQVWADFKRQRKKPLTGTALAGIEREVAKTGCTLNEVLTVCCERGWQGFKAEWLDESNRRSGNGAGRATDGFGVALAKAAAHYDAYDDGGMHGTG